MMMIDACETRTAKREGRGGEEENAKNLRAQKWGKERWGGEQKHLARRPSVLLLLLLLAVVVFRHLYTVVQLALQIPSPPPP